MTEFIRAPKSNRFVPPALLQPQPQPQTTIATMPPEDDLSRYLHDPLAYILDQFAWGERGSFLQGRDGPLDWQREVLQDIGEVLAEPTPEGHDSRGCRVAIASGKGCGKTTLMAWLFLWHVDVHLDSLTTVTSVTATQNSYRFWREMRKWFRVWARQHHYTCTTTRMDDVRDSTHFGAHQSWQTDKPEAFQGAHEKYVAFLVDEASAIPDAILDNIESGLSGEHIFVAYMANPTRLRGRFRETFQGERAKRWLTYNIDARNVDIVHRAHIQELLDDCNGDIEASSFRINVRGLFALVDYDQTIPQYLIDAACLRPAVWDDRAPIVIGADIARKGENKTVFLVRQRGTILEIQVFAKLEVDLAADHLIGIIQRYTRVVHGRVVAPDCFCDADGVGAGVVDCCTRQGYHVEEVRSALPAVAHQRYANRRAEMWFWARDWVKNEGCFDKTERWVEELLDQLGSVTYHRDNLDRIIIEPKESMLVSPDLADAFVYSFAEPRMLQAATW